MTLDVAAAIDGPVRRIGVFRALMLGDWLCATPALRAIAARWPDAELTLIGLPWTRELARRLSMVHRFVAFPGFPGLPEIVPDRAAFRRFLRAERAEPLDLLVQLHGSGPIVNALVAACRPRRSAGFVLPGGWCADPPLYAPWPERGHEIERLLALVDHLGIARQGTALEFPVAGADRAALADAWPGARDAAPYACVHPGSQLPSRRWPAERFAAVADRIAAAGVRVVLTGSAGEAGLTAAVRDRMRRPAAAVDLAGRTDLWTLGALVDGARLVVCNDTGISHVAAALGTPSVVVSSGGDAARWRPFDATRHTVFAREMPCRPCAHRTCPTGHECALAVGVDEVADAALSHLDVFANER